MRGALQVDDEAPLPTEPNVRPGESTDIVFPDVFMMGARQRDHE